MALDVGNFILSLTVAMAAAAGSSPAALVMAVDVWAGQVDEGSGVDPYAVVKTYGGPEPVEFNPPAELSIQCMATGKNESATLALAQRLYETLYADVASENIGIGRPRVRWQIAAKKMGGTGGQQVVADTGFAWLIHLVKLRQVPATVGRDAGSAKWHAGFNFDIVFERVGT